MIPLLVILCSFVFLAAANPLAQLLLQGNQNLLQNGFNNIPNLQLQQQTQSASPYAFPYSVQNPINSCPLEQNYLTQNPTSRQINRINSNDQQLNKFLSNPMLQMILDPKTKLIDQNGVEISKQSNNLPNKEITPHIINNYYILSPECLHTNKREGKKTIKVNDPSGKSKPKKDDKASHQNISQNVLNDQQKNSNSKPLSQNNNNYKKYHPIENNNKPSDRKGNGSTRENSHNDNSGRKIKKKQKTSENSEKDVEGIKESLDVRNDTEVLLSNNQNSTSVNSKRKRRRKQTRKHTGDSLEKGEVNLVTEKLPTENKTYVAAKTHIGDYDIKNEKTDSALLSLKENKDRTGKNYRISSRDDEVIKNIHAKFPAIPEKVIRNLLNYLRRQLRNHLKNNSSWQCTNYKPPIKFSQLFPQYYTLDFNNHKTKGTNNRRRNHVHNKRKKPKQVSFNEYKDTITTKDVDLEMTTMSPTTEELRDVEKEESIIKLKNIATSIDNMERKVNYTSTYSNTEPKYFPQNTRIETTTNKIFFDEVPKLGEEDVVNVLPENFVDDYYPDFRSDNMHLDNNDKNIRNLRHNRYYYTTSKNYLKQKGNINFDESTKIYYGPVKPTTVANKYKVDINEEANVKRLQNLEDSLEKPLESLEDTNYEFTPLPEELEFKTPPGLENPDFETKPIGLQFKGPYYSPEFKKANEDKTYAAKSSTYSATKQMDIPSKPKNDNIETVFAKSKVVKYGHNEDPKDTFNNNDANVVYAKSISAEYW